METKTLAAKPIYIKLLWYSATAAVVCMPFVRDFLCLISRLCRRRHTVGGTWVSLIRRTAGRISEVISNGQNLKFRPLVVRYPPVQVWRGDGFHSEWKNKLKARMEVLRPRPTPSRYNAKLGGPSIPRSKENHFPDMISNKWFNKQLEDLLGQAS